MEDETSSSVFFTEETHTLASALRPILECQNPDSFVACVHSHPLDDFIEVFAPSKSHTRSALLELKEKIAKARLVVSAR